MTIPRMHLVLVPAFALSMIACEGKQAASNAPPVEHADLLLMNGKIHTGDATKPWAEAIAVRAGKIVAVGDDSELAGLRGVATEVHDLGGKFAMPGLNDGHSHPAWGGVKALFQCNFPFTATPQEVARTIEACVAAQPEAEWISGGQWTSDFFVNNDLGSPREWLDRVSGDKAILLRDDSGHNAWVNSRALELAGIAAETPDPPGGRFEREPGSRQPNGLLVEAYSLANTIVPRPTAEQQEAGARFAVEQANRFGITGFKDASAEEDEVAAFHALDQRGELSVHVAAALIISNQHSETNFDYEQLERMREQYRSRNVFTDFTKIFLDGVPTASRTAAMLAPYLPEREGDAPVSGNLHVEPEALAAAVTELDRRGFTIKIHAAGDRSIRVALDAVAAARAANGDSGLRHELAHAEFIDEADVPRFAELGVVADFSPYIWFPSPIVDSIVGAVGERGRHSWPARSLLDSGAPMLAGSDWPSAVPDMNPWVGMEALVTRQDPSDRYPGSTWPEQAISLEEAIAIYTMGGARALKLEDRTGSISVGKSADIIVLDRDLGAIEPKDIGETQVLMTFFEGKLVYRKP